MGTHGPGLQWCVLVMVIALLTGACTAPVGRGTSLEQVQGDLERFVDDDWVPASDIDDGDRIRTVAGARLSAPRTDVWLLPGTEALLDGSVIILERGDAAVDGAGVKLQSGDTVVSGTGAFRVDAGVTPRAAVYTGMIAVDRPGEAYSLQRLRQVDLASRRLNGLDGPVAYSPEDPVDQRYLGRAIAFDAEVARFTTRLDELYGTGLHPPEFYASFIDLPMEDVSALTASAPNIGDGGAVGPAAEALMGLFVGRALAGSDLAELTAVADQIAHLRSDGARWGLVATVLDLEDVAFGATVDRALSIRADGSRAGRVVPGGGAVPVPPSETPEDAVPVPPMPLDSLQGAEGLPTVVHPQHSE